MIKLNVVYLNEFIALAETLNFSKAAENLYISQSSLTKHIQTMEKELGIQLFERSTNKVALSNYGRLLLPYALEMTERYDSFLHCLRQYCNQEKSTLTVYAIPHMAKDLAEIMLLMRQMHPNINLIIEEREAKNIEGCLESGECELAFLRCQETDNEKFEYLKYCSDDIVLALPRSHKLAAEDPVDLSALSNETFIFPDENTALFSTCMKACHNSGFNPRIACKGHHPNDMIELVAKGIGIMFLPKKLIDSYTNPNIVLACLVRNIPSSIYIARLRNKPISEASLTFWNLIAMNQHP